MANCHLTSEDVVPEYGYRKAPGSGDWVIDDEAAEVVRYVFKLCMQGKGPLQIARRLEAEKVLNISSYRMENGLSGTNTRPTDKYHWSSTVVSDILERREYTGCIVNFKTYSNSIWDKKRRKNKEEDLVIIYDDHPAIIDQDLFDKVQEIRRHRQRRTKIGRESIFSGMVFCHDCGSRMYFTAHRCQTCKDSFVCSSYRKRRCNSHYINNAVLKKLVWEHMQKVIGLVIHFEEHFRSFMIENLQVQTKDAIKLLSKKLSKDEARLNQLDELYIRLYEDNVSGKISDEKFAMMSASYENEQQELRANIYALQKEIEAQERKIKDLERFIKRVNECSSLSEINAYVVRELIKAIYVEEVDNGSEQKIRRIHIQYDLVGYIPVDELMSVGTA